MVRVDAIGDVNVARGKVWEPASEAVTVKVVRAPR